MASYLFQHFHWSYLIEIVNLKFYLSFWCHVVAAVCSCVCFNANEGNTGRTCLEHKSNEILGSLRWLKSRSSTKVSFILPIEIRFDDFCEFVVFFQWFWLHRNSLESKSFVGWAAWQWLFLLFWRNELKDLLGLNRYTQCILI